MRKTKESLANPCKVADQDICEAHETEVEENYEAINGATSSEGVGVGYDADPDDASVEEKAEASADGPLSQDVTDPPVRKARKKKKKGVTLPNSRSNHAAAYSSKAI